MGAIRVELSTGTKLRAKQTSYFLGTENVNRISLKINLLVHRKDQRKCKVITDAQLSEQTWCGVKEGVCIPPIKIQYFSRLKKHFFGGGKTRYISHEKKKTHQQQLRNAYLFSLQVKNTTILIIAKANIYRVLAMCEVVFSGYLEFHENQTKRESKGNGETQRLSFF